MLVSNATLTQVLDGSQNLDDYGAVGAAPDAVRWAGSVPAYLEQKTVRVQTDSGSEYQKQWRVYLQVGAPPVQIGVEDVLVLGQALPDGTTGTYRVPVLSDELRVQPGMPPDVQTVCLVVEPSA